MGRVGSGRVRASRVVFATIATVGLVMGLAMPASAQTRDAAAGGPVRSTQSDVTPSPSASSSDAATPSPSDSGAPTDPPATTPEPESTVAPPATTDDGAGVPAPPAIAPSDGAATRAAQVPPATLYTDDGPRELTGTPGAAGKATLTGRVTDAATGKPIAGVVIHTGGKGGGEGFASSDVSAPVDDETWTTDASGAFTIVLDGRTWADLDIDADPASVRLGFQASASNLVLGQSYALGEIALGRGALLSGAITLPAATAAELRASARVYRGDDPYGYPTIGVSGAPGATVPWATVVPPGIYRVQFSDNDGYVPLWWNGSSDRAGATAITLAAGDRRTDIDGALSLGSNTIAGTVLSASALPIAGASVSLRNLDNASDSRWATTDSSGRYVLGNVSAGRYVLAVNPRPGDGLPTYFGGVENMSDATPIVIPAGTSTTRTGIDVAVIPGAKVTGTFSAAAAATITAVRLQTPAGDSVGYADVSNGTFTFLDVRAGTYRLAVGIGDADLQPYGDTFDVAVGASVTVDVSGFAPVATGTLTVTLPDVGDAFGQRKVTLFDGKTRAVVAQKWIYGSDTSVAFTAPVGTYLVQFTPPSGAPTYYPSSTTIAGATSVEITVGADTAIVFAAGTGSIHGVVTSGGAPVAGLPVELFRAHNLDSVISRTTTGTDGSYSFSGLGVDNFAVHVASGDALYVPRWFGPSGSRTDATAIALDKDEAFDHADLAVELGGAATGAATGDDLSGFLYVYLQPDNGGERVTARSTRAADGTLTWSARGLAPGTYHLTAWLDSTQLTGPETVSIAAGGTVTKLDFAQPAPQVRGVVTSAATGSPVSADVVAEPVDTTTYHPTVRTRTTWDTGAYVIRDLEPGVAYRVRYSSSNLATQWWQGASTAAAATPIVAPAVGSAPVQADAALAAGITVSGRVIDSVSGAGLQGITLSDGSTSTTTGSRGEFSFAVSAPGTLALSTYSSSTYVSASTSVTVPDAGLTGVDIQLTRGYTISGTVTSRNNGVPLSNVSVGVSSPGSTYSGYAWTSTKDDGTYQTTALAPGDYIVSYDNYNGLYVRQYHDGAASEESATIVRITDAPVTGIDAQLSLGGVVRGTVRDASGTPIAGATIGVATAPASSAAASSTPAILGIEVITSPDGSFALPALDPGDYTLYVYTPAYRTFWYDGHSTRDTAKVIHIRAGETTTVDATLQNLDPGERALTPEQSLSSSFAIVHQPESVSVSAGRSAQFTAVASGVPVPSVQWQRFADGTWSDLSGETGTDLYVPEVTAELAGARYRAVFTQGTSTLTSAEATLSIVAAPVAPAAPIAPMVSAVTAAGAKIAWTAPLDGGATVSGYRLELFRAGESEPVRTIDLGATSSQTIGGLDEDTAYEITVAARNRIGLGDASPRTAFRTKSISVPDSPTDIAVRSTGQTSAEVSWAAPRVDGGSAITGYNVTVLQGGAPVAGAVVAVTGLTATITGLAPSTAYEVGVAAVNVKGASSVGAFVPVTTDATPPPVTVPAAPSTPSGASHAPTSVSLAWSAPVADGGSPVDQYSVKVYSDGVELPDLARLTSATSIEITGLVPGSVYTFAVAARNAKGFGAYSTQSAPVRTMDEIPVPVVPGAPSGLTVAAVSDTGATITWTAPTADGGATITSYDVTVTQAGKSVSATVKVSGTTATVTGLTAATAYDVSVAARNIAGAGVSASVPVTTATSTGPVTDPVPTDANRGDITVTPGKAPVGGALKVTGLAPNTTYRVWFFSTPLAAGDVTTDAAGAASVTVPVLSKELHRVLFQARDSGAVAGWSWFEVVGASPKPGGDAGGPTGDHGSDVTGNPSTTPVGGPLTLDRTGGDLADVAPWGVGGGLLVLSGLALIAIYRRRVHTHR